MTEAMTKAATPEESRYPIVYMGRLDEARRGGFLGLGGLRRDPSELIRPDEGHHVLVYKVGGRYTQDNASLGARDETVVYATQVSVVDVRKNAPVAVEFEIPSKDRDVFTVVAHFQCSVTDPVTVVRNGLVDPGKLLLHYVMSHHNATQMGLDFALSDINDVRRYVNAQLTAYHTVNPPSIDGMDVRMASVEVRTPQEEAELSRTQRGLYNHHVIDVQRLDQEMDITGKRAYGEHKLTTARTEYEGAESWQRHGNDSALAAERARVDADLSAYRTKRDQELDYQRRGYDQMVGWKQQQYDDQMRLAAQRAELERQGDLHTFRLEALQQAADLIGNDPNRAIHLAYVAGNLDAKGLTDELRDDRDKTRALDQAEADKMREERRDHELEQSRQRRLEADYRRQEAIAKLAADREDTAWQREEARRDAERKRQIDDLEARWAREDRLEQRSADLDSKRRRDAAHLEVVRELIRRGLLDSESVDFEQLVVKLGGTDADPILPISEVQELGNDAAKGGEDRPGVGDPGDH